MSSPRPISWTLEEWPVAELVKAIRHNLDSEKIAALADSVAKGNKLPAIIMLSDHGVNTILDGHHRVGAWAATGTETALVLVARPR